MFEKLEQLAKNNKKISDFHIRSGSPLAYRQTGEIIMVKDVVVKAQDLQDLLSTNCNEVETKKFQETHELDSAVTISGLRFRANFYKTIHGPAAVLRRVESVIPEMSQFDLPQVLYDIIDMHKGLVLVTGPTGSGKSTVVSLLPRFYDVSEGRITIDGEDIREFKLDALRTNIGTVQQDVFLFVGTLRENIAYGRPGASQEEVEVAAKAARIHEFITTLPYGYDEWVGERGVTLSGGQKQRIAIARTILLNPRILVFDDSTASVDTQTEFLIQQALNVLMEGRTTFVIAQRLRTVLRADEILVLDEGKIVERGKHAELLSSDGLYRDIYDLELREQEEALG